MQQTNTCNTQGGFFAIGLGLALTAVFGLTAVTLSTDEGDEAVVAQPAQQAPDLVYQDSDK